MFYLIQKKSGKVIDSSETKSSLRRQRKAMKNPSAYSISTYKTLEEGKANRGCQAGEGTSKKKVSKKEKTSKKNKKKKKKASK